MEHEAAGRTQKGNLNPDPHVCTPRSCCHWIRSRSPQPVPRVTPSQGNCLLSFPPQQPVLKPVVWLDMSSEPHLLSFPASSTVPHQSANPDYVLSHTHTHPSACIPVLAGRSLCLTAPLFSFCGSLEHS